MRTSVHSRVRALLPGHRVSHDARAGQPGRGERRARVADGALTVGTVAAFLQLVRRFFQPLQDLSEKFNILQAAMAAAERIFALLDTPATAGAGVTPDREARVAALRAAGVTVTFDDVWFHYARARGVADDALVAAVEQPDDSAPDWVLRDVSFTVSSGRDARAGRATPARARPRS